MQINYNNYNNLLNVLLNKKVLSLILKISKLEVDLIMAWHNFVEALTLSRIILFSLHRYRILQSQ